MNRSFEKNKRVFLLVTLFFIVFYLSSFVSAVNVGVSPASLVFKNVLRGGYAEANVVVSVDSLSDTRIIVNATGEIAKWLNFTKNFTVSVNNPHLMKISVTPPNDVPNKNYTGFVVIQTVSSGGAKKGNAVGIIRSTLDVYITVEVVDTEILQCAASNFGVNSVEKGDDAVFNMNVTNGGNVIIKPKIIIQIWNEDQTMIVKTINEVGSSILPTTKKQLSFRVNTGSMKISQYWVDVSVTDCLSSNLLTFDVLRPGTLKADGILLNLLSINETKVGNTIPIKAIFKNTGEKEVGAEFKGQITKSGKIIQLLDSPKFDIAEGKIGIFTFYFTPQSSGDYIISGRVYYSGKRSYELSTPVKVISNSPFSFILPVVYISLVLLIAFLFLKILKEKKSYGKVLRRLRR